MLIRKPAIYLPRRAASRKNPSHARPQPNSPDRAWERTEVIVAACRENETLKSLISRSPPSHTQHDSHQSDQFLDVYAPSGLGRNRFLHLRRHWLVPHE